VKSESTLCGNEAARKEANANGVLKLDFTRAWSTKDGGLAMRRVSSLSFGFSGEHKIAVLAAKCR